MVRKMTMVERAQVLGLLKAGMTHREVALETGRALSSISQLRKKARELGDQEALKTIQEGRGRPKLATPEDVRRITAMLDRNPWLSGKAVKRKLGLDGVKFSVRRIQETLFKNGLKSRHAARKPLLTERMKAARMEFATSHMDWTADQWEKVSYTDESTFRLFRGGIKYVRRRAGSDRFDQKFTRKTVKHPGSVMAWGMFDGAAGRGGLDFLKKGTTMNATRYIETLDKYLVRTHNIRKNTHLLQDSAPCHKAKKTMAWLKAEGIKTIAWPGNSPDLNPIENLWHIAKNYLEEKECKSVPEMKVAIRQLWHNQITRELCKTLARSMPTRLMAVINANGGHTKY